MTGEIPTEVGDLTNLYSLSLGGNQLTGEIPTEVVSLTNLRSLYLSDNQLKRYDTGGTGQPDQP